MAADAEASAQHATMKLEKAMAMVTELKTLKNDVMHLKQQTNESEQQKLIELRKIGDEKKELELKFNSFAESNNK